MKSHNGSEVVVGNRQDSGSIASDGASDISNESYNGGDPVKLRARGNELRYSIEEYDEINEKLKQGKQAHQKLKSGVLPSVQESDILREIQKHVEENQTNKKKSFTSKVNHELNENNKRIAELTERIHEKEKKAISLQERYNSEESD